MSQDFRVPRGAFDLVSPRSEAVLAVREAMSAPVRGAGYGYLETPIFEETALFVRGVGESTDVVTKEMYSFTTRGGDELTLRPEGTAPVLRAVVENGLHRRGLPVKVWYAGSYFRYERPQKGRFRHFSQVGAEVIGTDDPAADAETIVLAMDAYRRLGLSGVRLLINSLGSDESRPAFRTALQAYLRRLDLDEETRRRVELNPLRVLDDKRPEIQAALQEAPVIADFLSAADRAHHDAVR
ncbi:MAG: ATP phosphoribosyltransferase regulatory subunit, partial [Jiangellaceae bacterium]